MVCVEEQSGREQSSKFLYYSAPLSLLDVHCDRFAYPIQPNHNTPLLIETEHVLDVCPLLLQTR